MMVFLFAVSTISTSGVDDGYLPWMSDVCFHFLFTECLSIFKGSPRVQKEMWLFSVPKRDVAAYFLPAASV